MNNCTNTIEKANSLGRKRVSVVGASVLATGALLGLGAQAAFADTPNTTPTGAASASTSAGSSGSAGSADSSGSAGSSGAAQLSLGIVQAEVNAMLRGHVNGAHAQKLATGLVNDDTVFSLLPSKLQGDLTTLTKASPVDRTADAKKIATTALNGGYGSLIENLAKEIRSAHGDTPHSIVNEVARDLKRGGSADHPAARIAQTVTEHKDLASSLPAALTSDLRTLADASKTERSADLQKIETTALSGGYGPQLQKVAVSVAGSLASAG